MQRCRRLERRTGRADAAAPRLRWLCRAHQAGVANPLPTTHVYMCERGQWTVDILALVLHHVMPKACFQHDEQAVLVAVEMALARWVSRPKPMC